MPNSNDHLKKWEDLIDTVDKTTIPMDYISRIYLQFNDGRDPKTFDIESLREQGYNREALEEIIAEVLREEDDDVYALDVFVDVEHVARMAMTETEKLLKNLK